LHVDVDAVGERRKRSVAESSTAAVAKLVTKPASRPPVISGTTTRLSVVSLPAPRFSAASSRLTWSCRSAALAAAIA
jgi:hypothetical protein